VFGRIVDDRKELARRNGCLSRHVDATGRMS
jgi:hypothetical protein